MLPTPLLPSFGTTTTPPPPSSSQQNRNDSWTINPIDRAAYDNLFHENANFDGKLEGQNAVEFFKQSGLPQQTLGQIWTLSDMDHDGALDRFEFAIAMELTRRIRKGAQVPNVLPRELIPNEKMIYYHVVATDSNDWATFDSNVQPTLASSQRKKSNGSSQMPTYALGSTASFEQRIQLEGELSSAIAARRT